MRHLPLVATLIVACGCGAPPSGTAPAKLATQEIGDTVVYGGPPPIKFSPPWTVDGDEATVRNVDHRRGLLATVGAYAPYPYGFAGQAHPQENRRWPEHEVIDVTDTLVGVVTAPWCAMPETAKAPVKGLEIMRLSQEGMRRMDAQTRARCGLRLYVMVDRRRTRFLAVYGFQKVQMPEPTEPLALGRVILTVTGIERTDEKAFKANADVVAGRLLAAP